jgi:type VI secretion system protein ImpF
MAREEDRPVSQSVLDRLIDINPHEAREIPLTRAQSVRALKTAVRRDLEWLLNTRSSIQTPPESYEHLENSVYMYGLPDVTSLSADSHDDRVELLHRIQQAISFFEPRLDHVQVSESQSNDPRQRQVRFLISAVLKMDPSPEHVVFDTVLDISSRQYAIKGESSA